MKNFTGFTPVRRDRLIQEQVHDTYKARGKLNEPSVCPQCQAVFHDGRWQWLDVPAGAENATCPACHRINDDFPAGFVTVSGAFFDSHKEEVLNAIHNEGIKAKADHPLERVMRVEDTDEGVLVTTTGIHVARRIGESLHHAYHGELEFHYNADEMMLRVHWSR